MPGVNLKRCLIIHLLDTDPTFRQNLWGIEIRLLLLVVVVVVAVGEL